MVHLGGLREFDPTQINPLYYDGRVPLFQVESPRSPSPKRIRRSGFGIIFDKYARAAKAEKQAEEREEYWRERQVIDKMLSERSCMYEEDFLEQRWREEADQELMALIQ